MVANLLAAFRARLDRVTWMAPATKAEALRKLGTLQIGIGYADLLTRLLAMARV